MEDIFDNPKTLENSLEPSVLPPVFLSGTKIVAPCKLGGLCTHPEDAGGACGSDGITGQLQSCNAGLCDTSACIPPPIDISNDCLQETPDTNMEDTFDNPELLEISVTPSHIKLLLEEEAMLLSRHIELLFEHTAMLLSDFYCTPLEKKTDTTNKEWLEELLPKIRQAREDITSCGRIRDHGWYCFDPMGCLLDDWTRRVQELFNDDSPFDWNRNSTRNERFKEFISKELLPLPRKELLKQLESLTLYYLQLPSLKDNFPTRNDRLKKFIFEEVWPLPNMKLLKRMESLTWDYIKRFIQKKGNPTRDDRFINILFKELRSLPSSELPQQLEPLKLAFVKYFILRKWNPNRNDGFNKIIFDETWPMPNMELQQQLKSLTLDYIKHFIQKKWILSRNDGFIKILLEDLCSLPNIEMSDWLISLKWDCLKYFILKKWNSSRNDGFKKILFKELCSLPNMELLEWLESLKLDYDEESFHPKREDATLTWCVIAIFISEEFQFLPDIKEPKSTQPFYVESSHLKSEDAAPTCNDRFTELEFLTFSDKVLFYLNEEDAAPTWNDRLTESILRLQSLIIAMRKWLESIILDYEESFHPKREDATPTWCDRFTKFISEELRFLPDIKEPKSKQSFYDDLFHLKIENALPTWNGRSTELEFLGSFKPLTEKTKEVVNKLTQKVAFWSEAIIKLLLLTLFLLVSLCGFFTEKTKRGSWSKMSIAFVCLPVILCDDHMLSYHHTGMYYPEEGQYRFETVGYVDDQEIDMYSSESGINIPKSVWMEKHEGSDYWEKQTSMRRGWEKVFRDNLMILASRFNYTRSSHTLQLSYGCALHDNDFIGYYRYGFDGKDFLIFDQDTLLWTPGMQKAEISAQRWNSDSDIGKGVKSYLTEHCKSALKKYIVYGREELEKRVVPEVMVKGQKINGNIKLQCLVYGFHPRPVHVKWVRNGKDDVPSDEISPILPHPDGTYQIRVSVEVPTKEGDTYSCHVDHSSLEDVLTKKWEPDHARILHTGMIPFVLALLLVLAFILKRQVCLECLHLQGKWKKEPETAGCPLRTEKPDHLDHLESGRNLSKPGKWQKKPETF